MLRDVHHPQDAFTIYFACDFFLRLWIASDSFLWYFSLVSLLDFVTVAPMLVLWLITAGAEYDTSLVLIVSCIRVLRVARVFRVIRVVRSIGGSSTSYAFQRQVAVLVLTVLSMIFVTSGIYQIFEVQEYNAATTKPAVYPSFQRALYYGTVTVVGRPAVPVTSSLSVVFLTGVVMLAATIIPTFVAELIRLWFDQAALDTYYPNPEAKHVVVCGDTNVSRLRALAGQYFHRSRDPESLAPLVILGEAKPEGALRSFIDGYKHSGLVRYIRGSARRAPDLRRAGVHGAASVVVLNYRADRDAGAADTEVLSTVMAVKAVAPDVRVLAQLARPRKRVHLKAVPGWHDGDKSFASPALGMTLVGLGTALPGLPTLVTNLLRRGTAMGAAGAAARRGGSAVALQGSTTSLLRVLYYGDRAKPAAAAALATLLAREEAARRPRTPLEEYAASVDQTLHELPVTPGLAGRTFASAARAAYLRYGVMLIGATVPLNDDVCALMPGLPRTYRVRLHPSRTVLATGMRLYAVADDVERLRLETGGLAHGLLARVAGEVAERVTSVAAAFKPHRLGDGDAADGGRVDEEAEAADGAGAGSVPTWLVGTGAAAFTEASYTHNRSAATDITVPWCWVEHGSGRGLSAVGGAAGEFVASLRGALHGHHQSHPTPPSQTSDGGAAADGAGASSAGCESCRRVACETPLPQSVLAGNGIVRLPSASPPPTVSTALTSSAAPADVGSASSGASPGPALAVISGTALARRKQSFGDDGLGGIDDTDDVTGIGSDGSHAQHAQQQYLRTTAPSVHHAGGVGATAAAAALANMNSLAVRLALPVAAAGTDIEGMAAEAKARPAPFAGHVLVCGVADSIGYLLRAIASQLTAERRRVVAVDEQPRGAAAAAAPSSASDWAEGEQYDLRAEDVVVLAPAKPADAAMNAMYAGRCVGAVEVPPPPPPHAHSHTHTRTPRTAAHTPDIAPHRAAQLPPPRTRHLRRRLALGGRRPAARGRADRPRRGCALRREARGDGGRRGQPLRRHGRDRHNFNTGQVEPEPARDERAAARRARALPAADGLDAERRAGS